MEACVLVGRSVANRSCPQEVTLDVAFIGSLESVRLFNIYIYIYVMRVMYGNYLGYGWAISCMVKTFCFHSLSYSRVTSSIDAYVGGFLENNAIVRSWDPT